LPAAIHSRWSGPPHHPHTVCAQPARRADPPGCQEDRQDPGQRRVAPLRPRCHRRPAPRQGAHRLWRRARRRRPPLPPGHGETLPDESGATSAAVLLRAAAFFAAHRITNIEQVIIGIAWSARSGGRGRTPPAPGTGSRSPPRSSPGRTPTGAERTATGSRSAAPRAGSCSAACSACRRSGSRHSGTATAAGARTAGRTCPAASSTCRCPTRGPGGGRGHRPRPGRDRRGAARAPGRRARRHRAVPRGGRRVRPAAGGGARHRADRVLGAQGGGAQSSPIAARPRSPLRYGRWGAA